MASCAQCGTEVAPSRLSCPACHGLIHAAELKGLAAAADAAAGAGDLSAELAAWRRALELLPPGSRQLAVVTGKVDALARRIDAAPAGRGPTGAPAEGGRGFLAKGGTVVALGLLLWKLKAVLLFALTKGKLLLLGLTKSGTVFTMALSLGVYWVAFGWAFALGLVLSIYVHEMGHVAALQRFGIRASFPMFIPGIGAVVRLKQHLASPWEDARVGLAGPLWGLGAAVVSWLVFLAGGGAIWGAIARVGAWINLFNLLPVWQLDGGRAFHALSRGQRALAAAALAAAWLWTREGLLVLLALAAAFRAWKGPFPNEGDRTAIAQYLFLVAALAALCTIEVPLGEGGGG